MKTSPEQSSLSSGKDKQAVQQPDVSALGSPLSLEQLAHVTGGITTQMPPLYYGDASHGDMRLIPKTPLVSK